MDKCTYASAECPGNAYPMLRVEELLDGYGKVKFITLLDLALGYRRKLLEIETGKDI